MKTQLDMEKIAKGVGAVSGILSAHVAVVR